jgi:hypothetical protein
MFETEKEDFAGNALQVEQLLGARYKAREFDAERRMLQAMLLDAINCWQRRANAGFRYGGYVVGSRERLYREAEFWIFGDYDNAPSFSFACVCECLDINPDYLRSRLIQWREQSSSAVERSGGGVWLARRSAVEPSEKVFEVRTSEV